MDKKPNITKFTDGDKCDFYSEKYGEFYKSKSGAEEEAFRKFVGPTNIQELAKSGKVSILDICFGLGHNSAAAIDAIREVSKTCKIEIIALENDIEIIQRIEEISPNFKHYNLITKLAKNHSIEEDNISIKLIIGDARDVIKQLKTKFDIIFLDPFSPKKCPELWTEEFFKDIAKLSKSGTALTTYSCARVVRDNLKKAGFRVEDGPCISRRGPSTVAFFL